MSLQNCEFTKLELMPQYENPFLNKYGFAKFISLIKQKYKINNLHYNLKIKQK